MTVNLFGDVHTLDPTTHTARYVNAYNEHKLRIVKNLRFMIQAYTPPPTEDESRVVLKPLPGADKLVAVDTEENPFRVRAKDIDLVHLTPFFCEQYLFILMWKLRVIAPAITLVSLLHLVHPKQ